MDGRFPAIGSFRRYVLSFIGMACVFQSYALSITSFSPAAGAAGTSVIISGSGFNTIASNNVVFFGATKASISSASANSLTVSVPMGANYQYITVTNLGTNLTAYSSKPFNMTTSCSGTPGFAAAVNFQGGSHNVEIYDMDGDGLADLVIPDYFNNTLAITRNTSIPGTISFAPKVTYPWASGGQPNEVSIGDFDGDGKPDVAVGGNGGGTFVSVYRNTSTPGTISLGARQDFTASSGQGNGNRIIDIDGDGKPDLLSVHWSGNCLWVLKNTSTGVGNISFAAGVSFTTTTQPHKIDVGDLDGDGKPDVVITAFTSNMMSVFRNTSTPGSISFAARQDFAPGTVPYFVHVGDLDGDGKADIAVVDRDVATLAIYRNTSVPGSISLAAKQNFATPSGTMTHYGVAFGDVDGDGKPDIAVGNYTLNITSLFRNTSTVGTINFAPRVDLASGVSYDVGIEDFDKDTRPDIVVTNSGSTVSVLANMCTLLLPIELISFSGVLQENQVLLSWSTASEMNNDHFTLERSNNAIDFIPIGEVKGAGNSSSILNYTFTDEHPSSGLNYYRLKQIDRDGHFTYSSMISVVYVPFNLPVSVYPNPFQLDLTLRGTKNGSTVILFDMNGKEVLQQSISDTETSIETKNLSSGFYLLHYSDGEITSKFKVVKF